MILMDALRLALLKLDGIATTLRTLQHAYPYVEMEIMSLEKFAMTEETTQHKLVNQIVLDLF